MREICCWADHLGIISFSARFIPLLYISLLRISTNISLCSLLRYVARVREIINMFTV
jgi:hypothetical protein